jgi:hypothetical protein
MIGARKRALYATQNWGTIAKRERKFLERANAPPGASLASARTAALSGSRIKAPGSAGGYLLFSLQINCCIAGSEVMGHCHQQQMMVASQLDFANSNRIDDRLGVIALSVGTQEEAGDGATGFHWKVPRNLVTCLEHSSPQLVRRAIAEFARKRFGEVSAQSWRARSTLFSNTRPVLASTPTSCVTVPFLISKE